MAPEYASKQPSSFNNHVKNIAIVGAGGRAGTFAAEALIAGGKHKVTAITRPDSTNVLPTGLHEIKHVNYDSRLSLVDALKGQDVLIITMNVAAPKESQVRLIDAAVEAGVKWIMPNEWGVDHGNEQLGKDSMLGDGLTAVRKHIEKVGEGKMHWIGMACGFWYEFSLAGTEVRYGFDFEKKELTLFDDGNTKICTSTWPQVGRGIASLLSLKVLPEDENDKSLHLSQWADRSVYIDSFCVSQRDMFESVLRVTGDSETDWKISHEDVHERYQRGAKMLKDGNLMGFGMLLYARDFFPDGSGDFTHKLDNEKLGLPREDLDGATKVAVEMALRGEQNAIGPGAAYSRIRS